MAERFRGAQRAADQRPAGLDVGKLVGARCGGRGDEDDSGEAGSEGLVQNELQVQQFQRPEVVERRVRIGVTELTAMTWLPRFVNVIQQCHPRVVIEPDVDMSTALRDKLLADEVELIIVPDAFDDSRFTSQRVGTVVNAWMCRPGLVNTDRPLRIHELVAHRLLTQGERSGTGLLYERWFKSIGVRPANTMTSNSLVALMGLAVSGFGIGYLPRNCLWPMVEAGLLEVVKVKPELPETPYSALCKSDRRSTLLASLVMLAQGSCDFGSTFQTGAVA